MSPCGAPCQNAAGEWQGQHIEVSAGHGDQGQRRPRHRPDISLLMEWWMIHHRAAFETNGIDAVE